MQIIILGRNNASLLNIKIQGIILGGQSGKNLQSSITGVKRDLRQPKSFSQGLSSN